ncbi:CorA metal ion transporter [Apophysomyces sp. BC1034]|nr:CorA metal ion transporter [Apophysomyces sp. BC1015]KAG0194428.1 CorA metal ion transporter [Apophysomyces sp. BC1034]
MEESLHAPNESVPPPPPFDASNCASQMESKEPFETIKLADRKSLESLECFGECHLHPLDPVEANVAQNGSEESFVQHQSDIYSFQTQLAAKLDDLLDSEENDHYMRRYSLYGERIYAKKVQKGVKRYRLYCASGGPFESRTLDEFLMLTTWSEKIDTRRTIMDLLIDTSGWWVDIFAPTNQEMRALSKIFRIHPLTTEDIQAQESREKCEIFQHYTFISFRSFNQDFNSPGYLCAINFYIIIFKEGVLTFRFQPLPHPQNVRNRIDHLKDYIHVTPEWINYALIDSITDGFAPVIQHTELEVDSIDDLVLVLNGSEQADMLRRIGSCRKTVMQMLRLLSPKADVLRSLIKRYEDKAKEVADAEESNDKKPLHEVLLYLGDIQGRAHRNYLGQMSIEVSQAGNTTNEVINRLTFLATIVVPLNLVATLFGMNVHVPGEDFEDLVFFFWIVLGMAFYAVTMVAVGKRIGFL